MPRPITRAAALDDDGQRTDRYLTNASHIANVGLAGVLTAEAAPRLIRRIKALRKMSSREELIHFSREDEDEESGSPTAAILGAGAAGTAAAALPGIAAQERAKAVLARRALAPALRGSREVGSSALRGLARGNWKMKAGLGIAGALAGGFIGTSFTSRVQRINLGLKEDLIQFAPLTPDPRPRNDLGMFKNEPDMGPNPNIIHITYKEGQAAAQEEGALAKLAGKLRRVRK